MPEPRLTIAAVERDLGLSKDVLRVWERRYGFPAPERDANGERLYPAGQLLRLHLIKRLVDLGHRPRRLMAASTDELEALMGATRHRAAPIDPGHAHELDVLVGLVRAHNAAGFLQALQQRLAKAGLLDFVQDTVAPLTVQIGSAWEQGRLHVFEEHLFTELTARVLRQAIAAAPGGSEPRVLLTTLPKEPHELGLLMVEAALTLEGARCIPLGTQTPLLEIVDAAGAHEADVVALSFSAAFASRQIPSLLEQLRGALPARSELWAGGAGVRRVAAPTGVLVTDSLSDAVAEVKRWRRRAD